MGLEFYANNDLHKALIHIGKFYVLVKDVSIEEYPTKKLDFIYLGKFHYRSKDYNYAEKSLEIAQKLPLSKNRKHDIDMLNTIGLVKREQGNYDQALSSFNKAKALAQKLNDSVWVKNIDGDIGILYYLHGIYDKAYPLLKKTVASSLQSDDHSIAINSTVNLADIYRINKQIDSAEYYVALAREILKDVKPAEAHLVSLFKLMGLLYADKGNYHKAYLFADS